MRNLFTVLALAIVSFNANAAGSGDPLPKTCLKKVAAAVEKEHDYEGAGVYAIKQLHNGEQASVLIVGVSDEVSGTDYYVVVKNKAKERCRIASITYGSWVNVENYEDSELTENLFK